MRKLLILAALAAATASAAAQTTQMKPSPKPPKVKISAGDRTLARTFGVWSGKATVGKQDSVITTFTLISTGTREGWTTLFPNREPLPTRVIAAGGDSVVTEVGPYPSLTRPGQTATTRMTQHVHGNRMRGTFFATFNDGRTLSGKTDAKRKK